MGWANEGYVSGLERGNTLGRQRMKTGKGKTVKDVKGMTGEQIGLQARFWDLFCRTAKPLFMPFVPYSFQLSL